METKISLTRIWPGAIADLIISFITPHKDLCDVSHNYHALCAVTGFYERAQWKHRQTQKTGIWREILFNACANGHIEIARRAAVHVDFCDFDDAIVHAAKDKTGATLLWAIQKYRRAERPPPKMDFMGCYCDPVRDAVFMAAIRENMAAVQMIIAAYPPGSFRYVRPYNLSHGVFLRVIATNWKPEIQRVVYAYIQRCEKSRISRLFFCAAQNLNAWRPIKHMRRAAHGN